MATGEKILSPLRSVGLVCPGAYDIIFRSSIETAKSCDYSELGFFEAGPAFAPECEIVEKRIGGEFRIRGIT